MTAFALPLAVEPESTVIVTPRAPGHIASLDGMRAASFLLVFASHVGLDAFIPGAFGVTVFFFLSGYLITTLMRVEVEATGRVRLTDFYLRRALRILPPFYIVLVAATALAAAGVLRGDLQPGAVASQLLHFSNYWRAAHGGSGVAEGTGVYWSLAVEEHFYLVFPTVFVAMSALRLTGRQRAFGFWGACAIVLVWRCILVLWLRADTERLSLCSDTRVDSIAFGCALGVWNNPVLDASPGKVGGRAESALSTRILFAAGVAVLLVTFVVRGPVFRETLRYTLQGIALTPIFIVAVRHPRWYVFRPLNWGPVRFIGKVSYSLYLVHHVVIKAVVAQHSGRDGVARAIVALLVSVGIAWAMFTVVERPCSRLRRRLSVTP